MSEIESHRDLAVWQKVMALAEESYRLAARFPESERFGLWSQLTRCATSVPANIAEGHGRFGSREFANFLSIARGSLSELETHLELAVRLGYIREADALMARNLASEVGKMLTRLIQSLRR
ncbi:MAG TPA: four helix bundle protein [Tepidiformaceae bacterium]|nr:four helix bundle protein [Tepidiformaceae bacterium]